MLQLILCHIFEHNFFFFLSSTILYEKVTKVSYPPDDVAKQKKSRLTKFWFVLSEFKWLLSTGNINLQSDGLEEGRWIYCRGWGWGTI